MSHHLEIDTYGDELHLRLICTATPGSDCRKRPADPEQESWASDDPTLTDGHECWAVEWVESGGWECIGSARDAEWPTIPVTVEYDEGVIVAPIVPQETLPDHDAAIAEAARDYERIRRAHIDHGPLLSQRKAAHDTLIAAVEAERADRGKS